jgi:uncharacterized protein involved in type VI secretion and phage assembly
MSFDPTNTNEFTRFFENLLFYGLEFFNKYYGCYRGDVTRNDDPQNRGRIQVIVPTVGHTIPINVWVDPAFAGAGTNRGMFWPPEVGDSVRVWFEGGDASKPCGYLGGWFGTADVPSEFATTDQGQEFKVPEKRGFITRGGHSLVFNDTEGEQSLEITWNKPASQPSDRKDTADRSDSKNMARLKFVDGGIELVFKDDQKIEIQDGVIKLDASKIEIATGADQKAVRGDELVQYLNTHNHGTAWGPSSPPLSPVPVTVLSTQTKLK